MPDRHREAWNEEDIATLRRGFARKQPVPIIARELERSQEAVRRKALQLGLIEPRVRRSPAKASARHVAGRQYRISVFGEAKTDWRDTQEAAREDAISAGLASWDASERKWFLAVPVEIEWRDGEGG